MEMEALFFAYGMQMNLNNDALWFNPLLGNLILSIKVNKIEKISENMQIYTV